MENLKKKLKQAVVSGGTKKELFFGSEMSLCE